MSNVNPAKVGSKFKGSKDFFDIYSERLNKAVIARSEATWQSHEIASLQVRNDTTRMSTYLWRSL